MRHSPVRAKRVSLVPSVAASSSGQGARDAIMGAAAAPKEQLALLGLRELRGARCLRGVASVRSSATPLAQVSLLAVGVHELSSLCSKWSTPHAVEVVHGLLVAVDNALVSEEDEEAARPRHSLRRDAGAGCGGAREVASAATGAWCAGPAFARSQAQHGCLKVEQCGGGGTVLAVAGHNGAPDHALRAMRAAAAVLTVAGAAGVGGERLQVRSEALPRVRRCARSTVR